MHFEKLERGELIAVAGGIVLLIGLFLKWYEYTGTSAALGKVSGWHAHPVMRWLVIAGALAPLILAWIVVRDHELSWPRGQVTSIVAIALFGLLFYNGVIDQPGSSQSLVQKSFGWYVAFAGTILMLVGSLRRQQEHGPAVRKPPGVA